MTQRGNTDEPETKIRLCVLGDGNVGKSALTIRYFQDQFVEDWDPTIEDLYVKRDQIDARFFQLEVQDTAGQEQFALLREDYIQNAHGFLIVFAVAGSNAQKSMQNLQTYFTDIRRFHGESIPIIVAANKIDLRRQIQKEEGEAMVEQLRQNHTRMGYIETSAKTKENVIQAFQRLCELVLQDTERFKTNMPTRDQASPSDPDQLRRRSKNPCFKCIQ